MNSQMDSILPDPERQVTATCLHEAAHAKACLLLEVPFTRLGVTDGGLAGYTDVESVACDPVALRQCTDECRMEAEAIALAVGVIASALPGPTLFVPLANSRDDLEKVFALSDRLIELGASPDPLVKISQRANGLVQKHKGDICRIAAAVRELTDVSRKQVIELLDTGRICLPGGGAWECGTPA